MFGVMSCAGVDLVRSWVMVECDYSLAMSSSKAIVIWTMLTFVIVQADI
jgi:hypothetical protein